MLSIAILNRGGVPVWSVVMHAAFCQFCCAVKIAVCVVGVTIGARGFLLGQEVPKNRSQDDKALTPFIVKSSWLKFGVFDGRI